MKLTSDEAKMLRDIANDAHGELRIHTRSPILARLRGKGLVRLREDGDYDLHLGLSPAGRAALESQP